MEHGRSSRASALASAKDCSQYEGTHLLDVSRRFVVFSPDDLPARQHFLLREIAVNMRGLTCTMIFFLLCLLFQAYFFCWRLFFWTISRISCSISSKSTLTLSIGFISSFCTLEFSSSNARGGRLLPIHDRERVQLVKVVFRSFQVPSETLMKMNLIKFL